MSKHRNRWVYTEVEKLVKNYDEPIQVLEEMFPRHSKASIQRKINDLRKMGRIKYKSKETVKKAYKLRHDK
jgi:hypothetical protein